MRELREDRDLSQKTISKLLETSQQHYSKYETGVHELPLRHLLKLVEFYNVSADYLLGRGINERKIDPCRTDIGNIYVTYGCSCKTLLDNILLLDEDGREDVVKYVQLQNYRIQLLGTDGRLDEKKQPFIYRGKR